MTFNLEHLTNIEISNSTWRINMPKYTVALQVGGVMEQPHFTYEEHQTIEANSEKEAEEIYNRLNNCSYYYGKVVGKDGIITLHNEPIKHNSFC